MTDKHTLPLADFTVVAIEQAVATRHLADCVARVLDIERPDTGDFARGYNKRVNGPSSYTAGEGVRQHCRDWLQM